MEKNLVLENLFDQSISKANLISGLLDAWPPPIPDIFFIVYHNLSQNSHYLP